MVLANKERHFRPAAGFNQDLIKQSYRTAGIAEAGLWRGAGLIGCARPDRIRRPSAPAALFTRSAGFEHSVVRRQSGLLAHSEKRLNEMGRRG